MAASATRRNFSQPVCGGAVAAKAEIDFVGLAVRLEAAPLQNRGGWPDLEPSSMLTQ